MTDNNWNYTAAEKRAICNAFDAVSNAVDTMGWGSPQRLLDAVKCERRERSCMTAAKWLIVEGFCLGLIEDPRASEIAGHSAGIVTATVLGAGCRHRGAPESIQAQIVETTRAAKAAHDSRMARGIAAARGDLVKTA
jgi:hypothetical protein